MAEEHAYDYEVYERKVMSLMLVAGVRACHENDASGASESCGAEARVARRLRVRPGWWAAPGR